MVPMALVLPGMSFCDRKNFFKPHRNRPASTHGPQKWVYLCSCRLIWIYKHNVDLNRWFNWKSVSLLHSYLGGYNYLNLIKTHPIIIHVSLHFTVGIANGPTWPSLPHPSPPPRAACSSRPPAPQPASTTSHPTRCPTCLPSEPWCSDRSWPGKENAQPGRKSLAPHSNANPKKQLRPKKWRSHGYPWCASITFPYLPAAASIHQVAAMPPAVFFKSSISLRGSFTAKSWPHRVMVIVELGWAPQARKKWGLGD